MLNLYSLSDNNMISENNNRKYIIHKVNLSNMPTVNSLLSRKMKTPSIKREEPILHCEFKYKDLNTNKSFEFSKKLTKSQLDRLKNKLQYKKNTYMEYKCHSEDGTHQETFQTSNFMSSSSSLSKKPTVRSLPKTKTVFVRSKKVKSKPIKKKVSSIKKTVVKPVKKKVSSVKKPVTKPIKKKVVPKKKSTKRKSKQSSKVLSRKDLNSLGAELLGEN